MPQAHAWTEFKSIPLIRIAPMLTLRRAAFWRRPARKRPSWSQRDRPSATLTTASSTPQSSRRCVRPLRHVTFGSAAD